MNSFKDFNISPQVSTFRGDKIPVKKLLNLPIKVLDFKLEPSKQKPGTELLTLQIEKSEEKRIVFTGSSGLISQVKQLSKDKLPFTTVIKGDNEYYEFT